MSNKKSIVTGTLILTISGFLSRILGFYNRIFLSRTIGAKELGIYQLIFPVYLLSFTLCCHGFETGVSNLTSRYIAGKQPYNIRKLLRIAISLSLFLSFTLIMLTFSFSGIICSQLLKEPETKVLLNIASLALPSVALKSCLHGFYIGLNRSSVPAFSQLIEQLIRVGSIYFLSISVFSGHLDARLAIWGMVIGETGSAVYTVLSYLYTNTLGNRSYTTYKTARIRSPSFSILKKFAGYSIPLTFNHFSITIISSLEAILIPNMLTLYYSTRDQALASYGILTGMAIPFLFFPATITNSLSVMLLPAISSSYKQKKMAQIHETISKSLHYCIVIGLCSMFGFLLYGNTLGTIFFQNKEAGQYICLFSLLCPFMYVSHNSSSILNGLGKTKTTLFHSLLGLGIRIFFILRFIPSIGAKGYLYGLLLGYFAEGLTNLCAIRKIASFSFDSRKSMLIPSLLSVGCGLVSLKCYELLLHYSCFTPILLLIISGSVYLMLFLAAMLFMERDRIQSVHKGSFASSDAEMSWKKSSASRWTDESLHQKVLKNRR